MKKTTKTFAILAALAVFGTTGLFAQPTALNEDGVETVVSYEGAKTIAVTVKVTKRKNLQTVYLKLKDGSTYLADSIGPEGEKALDTLISRNGKKAVVSGFFNEKSGIFNIIKMGGLTDSDNPDQK